MVGTGAATSEVLTNTQGLQDPAPSQALRLVPVPRTLFSFLLQVPGSQIERKSDYPGAGDERKPHLASMLRLVLPTPLV